MAIDLHLVRTNLESPTGPKLRRKNSAEPTMTIHTRAATDDILDIFNQPLRNLGATRDNHADSGGESDYDEDDYTSAGESTGTGRISGASEFGDDETGIRVVEAPDVTDLLSASKWSDFTTDKHSPKHGTKDQENLVGDLESMHLNDPISRVEEILEEELSTPISPEPAYQIVQTKFIPIPPEDYEPPTQTYRDHAQMPQNRLPFMTPIVEKTESSMGLPTVKTKKDYFGLKTPSRQKGDETSVNSVAEAAPSSSPFQETVNEPRVEHPIQPRAVKAETKKGVSSRKTAPAKQAKGAIIKDAQCNPVDEVIRSTILQNLKTPLSTYTGYYDHKPQCCNKGQEIRKFVKALVKTSKNASEKTATNLSIPPTITFPHPSNTTYAIRRELGKGAFAPVYLAEKSPDEAFPLSTSSDDQSPRFLAMKCESPPNPWEFYIMATAHKRLGPLSRATASLAKPHSMHLFADEGYLLEEYRDQGTLLDLVNLARSETLASASSNGLLDETIVLFFSVELLRTVDALHSHGMLHGDLKADNCLVRLPLSSSLSPDTYSPAGDLGWASLGLLLIDFGRGIDMRTFEPGVQFIADWKTDKQDCPEMRGMRPWTWQVDWWGMAAIIHLLLFGRWMEDIVEKIANEGDEGIQGHALGGQVLGAVGKRHRLKETLKRYWQTAIWTKLFDTLMNPGNINEGGGKGIDEKAVWAELRVVRVEMEKWLEENGERRGLGTGLRGLAEKGRGKAGKR